MSENVVRQQNIETSSTATSIIPASTANSDYNSIFMITQNNQLDTIYSEGINLDISETLQKAKNLATSKSGASSNPSRSSQKSYRHDYGRSQSVTEGQGSLKPPQEASVDIYKAIQKEYNNAFEQKKYQILVDLWKKCMNSYLTVRKFLGQPITCKLLNGWHPFMEKKNLMVLTAEWGRKNPPPPKQVPKTAPVASSSNSNLKKQPQTQNKGKGKAPATNPYSQGYKIPNIQHDAMVNVFQMARTMIELQKKEEARFTYQK
ncbi:hypothetical protein O181_055418 [Austropuccinia psidii MF-1]|uniref:Uncharacterized protein n=1 Tax=Austropuccinia psidii MF-1 TaxID=1389203 RepID=A0A9Q3E7U2_9BASI|nr:hypothetical protein [Austropuccinia psidii MF-1]